MTCCLLLCSKCLSSVMFEPKQARTMTTHTLMVVFVQPQPSWLSSVVRAVEKEDVLARLCDEK